MDRAELLAEQLGLQIRDRRLLAQALTHTSWLHEHPGGAAGHNERLEFLGDAVVNLAVSEALYARHPEDDEGILSARRAAIVSSTGLATLADRIDLGSFLSLGEGESGRLGPGMPSILASALTNFLSSPAMVKPVRAPPLATSPPPTCLNEIRALPSSTFIDS